ncbi:hypothetical protein ACIRU8_39060 [Streptomyces sp. NPDC101175]|uniref:hypothetical protein n=1 Tax=Streptomyces sp. NPDC101175 TaxID=3366123 RepID=UPI00383583D7
MITIADHTLSRLVAQTKPHMATKDDPETLQSICFDHDGTWLYAFATNRFTLAVSRTQVTSGSDKPWAAAVHRMQVTEVEAAIKLLDSKPIDIERTDTQLVLSGESGSRIAVSLSQPDKEPMSWRKYLLPLLDMDAAAAEMSMTPKYFGAWKNLPGPVSMWCVGDMKPTLILAPDFIGMQMPVRTSESHDLTVRRELDAWKTAKSEAEPAPAVPAAA